MCKWAVIRQHLHTTLQVANTVPSPSKSPRPSESGPLSPASPSSGSPSHGPSRHSPDRHRGAAASKLPQVPTVSEQTGTPARIGETDGESTGAACGAAEGQDRATKRCGACEKKRGGSGGGSQRPIQRGGRGGSRQSVSLLWA